VSIVGSRESQGWEMKVWGANGFERSYTLLGNAGSTSKYSYDHGGHLDTVFDGTHVFYRFEYQRLMTESGYDPWLLTAILDGDWHVLLKNKYLWGRVSEQNLANGEVYRYEYRLKGRKVIQTKVTLPTGESKLFTLRDQF
jgi:hypothetical protein